MREPIHRVDGGQGPDEREPMEEPEFQHHDPHRDQDRDRRAERRARGGTQDVGIRQGIAQQTLERGAGHSQARAHDHRREDAREPQIHDDRLARLAPCARDVQAEQPMTQDADGLPGHDRHGSHADPQHEGHDEGADAEQGDHDRAAAQARRPPARHAGCRRLRPPDASPWGPGALRAPRPPGSGPLHPDGWPVPVHAALPRGADRAS